MRLGKSITVLQVSTVVNPALVQAPSRRGLWLLLGAIGLVWLIVGAYLVRQLQQGRRLPIDVQGLVVLRETDGAPLAFAVSPNGTWIAVSHASGVELHATNRLPARGALSEPIATWSADRQPIRYLAWAMKIPRLAIAHAGGVRVCDAPHLDRPIAEYPWASTSQSVRPALSPDGTRLAYCPDSHELRLLSVGSVSEPKVLTTPEPLSRVEFTPKSGMLWAETVEGRILCCENIDSAEPQWTELPSADREPTRAGPVALLSDQTQLLSVRTNRDSGEDYQLQSIDRAGRIHTGPTLPGGAPVAIALSRDERRVGVVAVSGNVSVSDYPGLVGLRNVTVPEPVRKEEFTADLSPGSRFASFERQVSGGRREIVVVRLKL